MVKPPCVKNYSGEKRIISLWRAILSGITDQGWIDSSVHFNRWLRENADKTAPKITLLDETERTLEESVEFAHQWIMDRIK